MNISSLKIVKARKRAIKRVVIYPLAFLFAVMTYLIINNYQMEQNLNWGWLQIYVLPLIFMVLFDAALIIAAFKQSNINQVLSQFSSDELAHIDSQFSNKISIFKTPLFYTDKVVFFAKGLNLQAIFPDDIIWLKHQTATGAIEIVTRQKKNIKVHSQFSPMFFKEFVENIKTHRPFVLVSNNQVDGEGKAWTELYKSDFDALVKKSDGVGA